MLTKPQVFYDDTHKQALGYQNPFYLKKALRIKSTLYDGSVISSQHVASPVIDDEEDSNLKNSGKRFVPQQELSNEQAFWLQNSHPNTDQSCEYHKLDAEVEYPKLVTYVLVAISASNFMNTTTEKKTVENAAQILISTTIAPGMFKIDLEPLAPRITSKKIVHLKETTSNSVETSKPEIKVYCRRPKQVKLVDVPSSSSLVNDRLSRLSSGTVRFRNDQVAKIIGYGDYQLGNKNTCFIQNLEGVDILSGSRDTNLYTISLDDMLNTSLICLLSKSLKSKSWLWHRRLSHLNFDTLNKLAKDSLARGPGLQVMTPATSSLGLIPNIIPQQPLAAAPRGVDIADLLVSTSIDQDAPSSSITSSQDQEHSLIISQGVEESPKTPLFHDDPLHELLHEDSTSQGSSSNVRPSHTPFELIGRWTKDHPIANVIGDPSRSVSTRNQLKTDAMWCYFDAFLTSIEPKNFKQAMTEPS
ncbi:integrase, catalytic region, zinc finger, CCHC-type containing protein [Tanacetum coccineum]|uniref:Integrase, catalytic region, zinc finger, CCHC-type containing protein n=1 Tax=Tanacetum coccineum TaxID=301880 RepID=A0ABQ4Y1B4_9ASTR